VFSWGEKLVAKVDTANGVTFRSYKDGRIIQVSPESSIQAQAKLGADIILVLDELLGFDNATRTSPRPSNGRAHWKND
jgi:queuine tRNA-ribosyltransferase